MGSEVAPVSEGGVLKHGSQSLLWWKMGSEEWKLPDDDIPGSVAILVVVEDGF